MVEGLKILVDMMVSFAGFPMKSEAAIVCIKPGVCLITGKISLYTMSLKMARLWRGPSITDQAASLCVLLLPQSVRSTPEAF